jgi:hypothetical protein
VPVAAAAPVEAGRTPLRTDPRPLPRCSAMEAGTIPRMIPGYTRGLPLIASNGNTVSQTLSLDLAEVTGLTVVGC